jgi:tetratricopeptide (TPR) repeat protein
MGRSVLVSASLLAVSLLTNPAGRAADQTAAVRDAVAAMQRGDFQSAEKTLRAEVLAHSDDSWALSLLGVALDNQKRVPEADDFHRRAVALSPHAAEILNNYGTHLWNAGQYDKAETVFVSVLATAPGYFQVLYNLGVMATYTGHYERAREALETALRQQPENVDVLYRLACVEEASKQWEAAVMQLAQAAKLDPRRADVQRLLALTTTELGALDDAAAAWERYLKLAPNDEVARRERGYTAAKMGKLEQAIGDLEWYVARHPDDPVGHYELGQAERTVDMTQALAHLDKALALDPNYVPARSARGNLYSQEGKPESAVKDLETAVSLQPDDALNLDRLGQTYQALDRTDDAVRVLRRAAELAPEDSKTLLHLGRALADRGRTEESKVVMERFRQLGPEKKQGVPAGLVEYLSLPPAERHAEYLARVENSIRDHPEDSAAQVAYLRLMIEDGAADKVASAAKRIAALKPGAAVLGSAGHALLEANHYALAKELLEQAAAGPGGGDVSLDLAIATFRAGGAATDAKAGLARMDGIPESERSGDYFLARAQMLDATGDFENAASALGQALGRASKRPDLYQRATRFLVRKGRAPEALKSIEEAARILPENREILLMKATTLEFAGQSAEAESLLNELQNRWPEWYAVWMAHGIILDTHRHYEEARHAMETAVTLGAPGPATYYFLADSTLRSGAAGKDAAETAIRQALQLSPDDPWIQALAGRIAFERREYQLAVERQRAAVRLRPQLVEGHHGLAQAYGALGRKQEAAAELAQIRKIRQGPANAQAGASAEDAPPYLSRLFEGDLFSGKARP